MYVLHNLLHIMMFYNDGIEHVGVDILTPNVLATGQ